MVWNMGGQQPTPPIRPNYWHTSHDNVMVHLALRMAADYRLLGLYRWVITDWLYVAQRLRKIISHFGTLDGNSGVDAGNIVYTVAWRLIEANSDVRMPREMTDNVAIGDLVEACLAIPWLCKSLANGSYTRTEFCHCNKISYASELARRAALGLLESERLANVRIGEHVEPLSNLIRQVRCVMLEQNPGSVFDGASNENATHEAVRRWAAQFAAIASGWPGADYAFPGLVQHDGDDDLVWVIHTVDSPVAGCAAHYLDLLDRFPRPFHRLGGSRGSLRPIAGQQFLAGRSAVDFALSHAAVATPGFPGVPLTASRVVHEHETPDVVRRMVAPHVGQWQEFRDPATAILWYFNSCTGEATWHRPPVVEARVMEHSGTEVTGGTWSDVLFEVVRDPDSAALEGEACGYLEVSIGDLVRVLFVGCDGEDAGWLFGEVVLEHRIGTTSGGRQGWIPDWAVQRRVVAM